MKRIRFAVAIALLAALFVTSFSTEAFAKRPGKAGGEMKFVVMSDPIYLCPPMATDSASSDVYQFMFEGLLKVDKGMKIIPGIAEMPTISADNKTFTFKLRKDVKWHDGKPFTSADVKFSYEWIMDKDVNSPRVNYFTYVDSVEAPDPYTVIVKMKQVDSSMMWTFTYPYIIPKHIWENVPRNNAKIREYAADFINNKPIGLGSFKFVSFKKSERVEMVANTDYYEGRPNFDKLTVMIAGSTVASALKVETGEGDMTAVNEADIPRMKTKSNINTFVYNRAAFDALIYNTASPYFDDVRVRQAVSYAINRDALIAGIYKGLAAPAYGSYYPSMWCYTTQGVTKYNYDLNKAKQLLDQAGWKVGKNGIRQKNGKEFSFVLLTNKGNAIREKLIVVIQSQLKLLGIKVEPRIVEWNTFLTKYVYTKKFDAYMGGFQGGATGDQSTFYHSNPAIGKMNYGSYKNTRIDELYNKVKLTFDTEAQKKMYAEIQQILSKEVPYTYIAYRKNAYSINKKVKGAQVYDIDGFMYFDDWYIDK